MSDSNTGWMDTRQESPQLGVDEISLNRGPYVFHVDGFGIQESDSRAAKAERAGEDVTIVFPRGDGDGW